MWQSLIPQGSSASAENYSKLFKAKLLEVKTSFEEAVRANEAFIPEGHDYTGFTANSAITTAVGSADQNAKVSDPHAATSSSSSSSRSAAVSSSSRNKMPSPSPHESPLCNEDDDDPFSEEVFSEHGGDHLVVTDTVTNDVVSLLTTSSSSSGIEPADVIVPAPSQPREETIHTLAETASTSKSIDEVRNPKTPPPPPQTSHSVSASTPMDPLSLFRQQKKHSSPPPTETRSSPRNNEAFAGLFGEKEEDRGVVANGMAEEQPYSLFASDHYNLSDIAENQVDIAVENNANDIKIENQTVEYNVENRIVEDVIEQNIHTAVGDHVVDDPDNNIVDNTAEDRIVESCASTQVEERIVEAATFVAQPTLPVIGHPSGGGGGGATRNTSDGSLRAGVTCSSSNTTTESVVFSETEEEEGEDGIHDIDTVDLYQQSDNLGHQPPPDDSVTSSSNAVSSVTSSNAVSSYDERSSLMQSKSDALSDGLVEQVVPASEPSALSVPRSSEEVVDEKESPKKLFKRNDVASNETSSSTLRELVPTAESSMIEQLHKQLADANEAKRALLAEGTRLSKRLGIFEVMGKIVCICAVTAQHSCNRLGACNCGGSW